MKLKKNEFGLSSHLWHKIFIDIGLPLNGAVIEIAPGYEPKIGGALSLLGFTGTVFLVEPDHQAASYIEKTYHNILPHSQIVAIRKPLQNLSANKDIPIKINALVASHPFDDMIIAFLARQKRFFSLEKNSRTCVSPSIKKIYNSLTHNDYAREAHKTAAVWQKVIRDLKPDYFIASQYPSQALKAKGLIERERSGLGVLKKLKVTYHNFLINPRLPRELGFKANPGWWIIAKYN